jgi:D-glycerate 3-kinase
VIAAAGLPPAYAAAEASVWGPLADHVAARHRALARPLLIGINGAQGSGKSTACRFLETLLAERGLAVATLSLDDLYLTRAERRHLADTLHPLFATRGVPGTHDLGLAARTIDALLAGHGPVAIPRFDKAIDDRAAPASWPVVTAPLDVLLFEGWCIGATPQPKSALVAPVNALEAAEDPAMTWRSLVNASLQTGYAPLFARLDTLVSLRAPGFHRVRDWRRQQEQALRDARGAAVGMDDAALDRFIQHFERLTRHMLETPPQPREITIAIAENHTAGAVHGLDRPAVN